MKTEKQLGLLNVKDTYKTTKNINPKTKLAQIIDKCVGVVGGGGGGR